MNTLNINLYPEKDPVETSIGTIYVRRAKVSDWTQFENDDAEELGKIAIRQLTNRSKDKKEDSSLAKEDCEALDDKDLKGIASAIAQKNGWGKLSDGSAPQQLGLSLKAAKEVLREQHKSMLDDMRESINKNYSFLGTSVRKKLQEQVAGLSKVMNTYSPTEAAFRDYLTQDKIAQKAMLDIKPEALSSDIEECVIEAPNTLSSRYENTPSGQVAIENAQNTRETARQMAELTAIIGGLNTTLITEVLPSWFKQVEQGQKSSKVSLDHAANGLWWTKWAVITSVVVAVITAWWQVSEARGIDRANTTQQLKIEAIFRDQLAAQQNLIEQQARDAAQLRSLVEQLELKADKPQNNQVPTAQHPLQRK